MRHHTIVSFEHFIISGVPFSLANGHSVSITHQLDLMIVKQLLGVF